MRMDRAGGGMTRPCNTAPDLAWWGIQRLASWGWITDSRLLSPGPAAPCAHQIRIRPHSACPGPGRNRITGPLLSGQVRIFPAEAHSGVRSRRVGVLPRFARDSRELAAISSPPRAGGGSVSSPCVHECEIRTTGGMTPHSALSHLRAGGLRLSAQLPSVGSCSSVVGRGSN